MKGVLRKYCLKPQLSTWEVARCLKLFSAFTQFINIPHNKKAFKDANETCKSDPVGYNVCVSKSVYKKFRYGWRAVAVWRTG